MDKKKQNKIEEDVHTQYFASVSAHVPLDYSDTGDECIDELVMRNNPVVRRAVNVIAAARVTLATVCSPWQQEADTIIEKEESNMPELLDLRYDSSDDDRLCTI
mmetsp:Transcript_59430/g.68319  ORF Transcript_59430/g.68319 Transcript_59430/m.68319 type:complete len:104 (+) Transcript_59430:92-403(+)